MAASSAERTPSLPEIYGEDRLEVEQEARGRERTRRPNLPATLTSPIRLFLQPRGKVGGVAVVGAVSPTPRNIDRHLNNLPTDQNAFNARVNLRRRLNSRSTSRGPTSTPQDIPAAVSLAVNPAAISPTAPVEREAARGRERTRRLPPLPVPIRVAAQPRGEAGGGAVGLAATPTPRNIDRHLNNLPTDQSAFNARVNLRRRLASRSNSRGPTSTPHDLPAAVSLDVNPAAISPTAPVRQAAAATTRSNSQRRRGTVAPTPSSASTSSAPSRSSAPSTSSAPSRSSVPSTSSAPRQPCNRAACRTHGNPYNKRKSFKSILRAYPLPPPGPRRPRPLTIAVTPRLETASRAASASRPAAVGEGGGSSSGTATLAVDIDALTARLTNPLPRSQRPEQPAHRPPRGPAAGVQIQRPLRLPRSISVSAEPNASATRINSNASATRPAATPFTDATEGEEEERTN